MRITFVTVMPSPYQRELFAALQASGRFDLRVAYYAAGAADRDWEVGGLDRGTETVLPGRSLRLLGATMRINPGIGRWLAGDDAELTVVSDYSAPTAQLAMRSLARRRRPWVYWGERPGFRRLGPAGRAVRALLQRPLRGRPSAIAAIGSRAVAAYRELARPEVPVFDIPYFCGLDRFLAAPRRPPGETVEVLFSGQLIPRKGADVLLRAFAVAAREVPELRLTLLGNGPQRQELEAMVPPELAPRVRFAGFLQPAALPAAFAAADIFVLPSRYDGWGLVVNEALGAGLPVLASNEVGAALDLVAEGINGWLHPAGDDAALAAQLVALGRSAELRSGFGEASRRIAGRWGMAEAVRRWSDLAAAVLGRAP